jgi:hypothetical protein
MSMDLVRNVTLEMSIKPFRSNGEGEMESVCRRLFRQWRRLTERAGQVSVLLWTADGSELLDFRGNLGDSFEWAKWQGVANPRHEPIPPEDPANDGVHRRPRLYMENPPERTYGWLARLVSALKRVGREETGLPVRVGTTFDPGPEFAVSRFKYVRHDEACLSETMGRKSFLCCYATLRGDGERYAGFPSGIPDGTPFGEFLGRQARCFCGALGFDYLWLSNGFGFGLETWGMYGALFRGDGFHPERAAGVREKILLFWRSFRAACPDLPVETRGTNLSTGMDLSSDAVPLQEIYRGGFRMEPPPNSPWAAINGDFGTEMIGWMSHVAEIPGDSFPFRFYTHDPWFLNSPWLDRYCREAHDIFLPLAVTRLKADGTVGGPTAVEFLTVDDSWGKMPDRVPNEVIPRILDCLETAPDEAGPLLWVYPFSEYHKLTYGGERIGEVFFGDWFLRGAFNECFPLNTVTSSEQFLSVLGKNPEALAHTIPVLPLPDGDTELSKALASLVQRGGRVLFYGPAAHAGEDLLGLLGLRKAPPLEGEFDLDLQAPADRGREVSRRIRHEALTSGGGLDAEPAPGSGAKVLAWARRAGQSRVLAVSRAPAACNGGGAAWVRGTNTFQLPGNPGAHQPVGLSELAFFRCERLMRMALREFGFTLLVERSLPDEGPGMAPGANGPMLTMSRNGNALYLAGHSPDTTTKQYFRLPLGAPVLLNEDAEYADGMTMYRPPMAWRKECRLFVEQKESGILRCREAYTGHPDAKVMRIRVSGLKDATLRFLPDPAHADSLKVERMAPQADFLHGTKTAYVRENSFLGECLRLDRVTGEIMFSW